MVIDQGIQEGSPAGHWSDLWTSRGRSCLWQNRSMPLINVACTSLFHVLCCHFDLWIWQTTNSIGMFYSPWTVNTFRCESWSALQNAKQGSSKLVDSDCCSHWPEHCMEKISLQDCSSSPSLSPFVDFCALGRGLIFVWRGSMWNCLSLAIWHQSLLPESHLLPIVFPSTCLRFDKWLSVPMFQLFNCSIAQPFVRQSGETNCHPTTSGICSHWFKTIH